MVPQGAEQEAYALPEQVVYPALAPGYLLRFADGLQVFDVVAQLLPAFLQRPVPLGEERHGVPALRDVVGGKQHQRPAAHRDVVRGHAPHGGVRKAEHLLPTKRLPLAAAERAAVQKPPELHAVLQGLARHLPCQRVHPAVAQQDVSLRAVEQQPRVQAVDGLLDGYVGELGPELPAAHQADVRAAQQEKQNTCKKKEGIRFSHDELGHGQQDCRPADGEKRPDELR